MCKLDKIFMVTWKMKCSSCKKPELLNEEQEQLFQDMVGNGCLIKCGVSAYDEKDIYTIDEKRIDDIYRFAY
ncbi:hypothetical protein [[Clostridium] polysaccharolyticum]|uniref:Uncharacterized protein n=1 Tax=[Clostridium] polysaccharolyticum TaxID=29364 RepID=A0A1I0ABG0_9FIRM|nr:hypothetical protein [[Clostridium] polysaccharolyticum]SES91488.1 hypothetical protein SAMN04487772_10564 [[Clostridium] polysaccharolyticum]